MKKLILASGILFALASCGSDAENSNTTEASAASDVAAVKDPVCDMVKTDEWTLTSETHGATYYFCSPHCKEQFDKDPHKYLGEHAH